MDVKSIPSNVVPTDVNSARDFCVSPSVLRASRKDGIWVEVPQKWDSSMKGLEICEIDVWGEKTCSTNTRFQPVFGGSGASSTSCLQAQSENPENFNWQRNVIERQPWTLTEMRKALRWIFNCSGQIPKENC